jgi:hypothetical protein
MASFVALAAQLLDALHGGGKLTVTWIDFLPLGLAD